MKVSGWTDGTGLLDIDLAKRAREIGASGIIYTNISRDGTLDGPDIERTAMIAKESKLPVILSGGISSMEDLEKIDQRENSGIVGVIMGKSLYENKFDLAEAVGRFQKETVEEVTW